MQAIDSGAGDPGIQALSALSGMPVEKVRHLRTLNNLTVSLDEPVTGGSETPWLERLADPAAGEPEDAGNDEPRPALRPRKAVGDQHFRLAQGDVFIADHIEQGFQLLDHEFRIVGNLDLVGRT